MKKFYSFCSIFCLFLSAAFAQTNSNRLVVFEKTGTKGFMLERVDSLKFFQVDGEVNAKISLGEVGVDTAAFTLTKSPDCYSYHIACVPTLTANRLTDEATAANYVVQNSLGQLYQETFNGRLSGLEANTEYTLMTVGMDKYDIACGVERASFKTLPKPLVGSPMVSMTVTDSTTTSFTCYFEPNEDVNGYAVLAGETGTMQEQYQMFGPWFGYKNFGEMVKGWGVPFTADGSFTWTSMNPGTEYEVFVQAWDENDTFAECQVFKVSTAKLGGSGTAVVTIDVKEFSVTDDGQYIQRIVYTPNEECALFRDIMVSDSLYQAWGEDSLVNYLKVDMPGTPYWDFYSTDDAVLRVNPSTPYVAMAIAKNADEVWGPVAIEKFSTPDAGSATPYGAPKKMKKVAGSIRMEAVKANVAPMMHTGTLPQIKKSSILLVK